MATSLKKVSINSGTTHEGAVAQVESTIQQLKRSVMTYMLWEDGFYESGVKIADRIKDLVSKCNAQDVIDLAIDAKTSGKLRHAPLYLLDCLIKSRKEIYNLSGIIDKLITRSDEILEVLALYWRDGKKPLPAQMKKGLTKALSRFNEYQLSRCPRDKAIKLRDVIRLIHPTPESDEQSALWKKAIKDELKMPDSWQTRLSAGANKKESWESLIKEKKLGALDVLRNLRNMGDAGVEFELIHSAVENISVERVLPFQFISAYRYSASHFASDNHKILAYILQRKMFECLQKFDKMSGTTFLLVDVSGSMAGKLSGKSELRNIDAASGIAIMAQALCERNIVLTFDSEVRGVPIGLNGFALADKLNSMVRGSTELGKALKLISTADNYSEIDRIIVFTDEQSRDDIRGIKLPEKSYLINIAANEKGVARSDKWHHVNGFSENVIQYICEKEKQ